MKKKLSEEKLFEKRSAYIEKFLEGKSSEERCEFWRNFLTFDFPEGELEYDLVNDDGEPLTLYERAEFNKTITKLEINHEKSKFKLYKSKK